MNDQISQVTEEDKYFSDEELYGVHYPEHGRKSPEWAVDDTYPRMSNVSAGMFMKRMVRPQNPERTELVTVPRPMGRTRDERTNLALAISRWNIPWEAAQFRRRFLDPEDIPPQLLKIAERGDVNVTLVPRTRSRYYEYSPLFHLLPRRLLERHGLPLVRTGPVQDRIEPSHSQWR